jgi:hypothetical protein
MTKRTMRMRFLAVSMLSGWLLACVVSAPAAAQSPASPQRPAAAPQRVAAVPGQPMPQQPVQPAQPGQQQPAPLTPEQQAERYNLAAHTGSIDAQRNEVISELATVYKGGNSPTDHAMQLAAKNLASNWSETQLKSAIGLARTNLRIRLNSIQLTEPVGARADNPYAPQAGSGKITVTAPDGSQHQFDTSWQINTLLAI